MTIDVYCGRKTTTQHIRTSGMDCKLCIRMPNQSLRLLGSRGYSRGCCLVMIFFSAGATYLLGYR